MIDIIDYMDGSRNGFGKKYDIRLDKSNPLRDNFFGRELSQDAAIEEFENELCRNINGQKVISPFHSMLKSTIELYQKHGKLRLFHWGGRMKEHARMLRMYITINA